MEMKYYIKTLSVCLALTAGLTACENGDPEFDDFGETTVYFANQDPVRVLIMGDDGDNDTSLDKEHKCEIIATFGGSYNGSNGKVQIAVDNSLVNNLTFADGTPVKAMPESYYTLSTNTLDFKGTFYGRTQVQLTDAFFADPDAVKNTYVIPVVMTGQTGFSKILTGTLGDGATESTRTDFSLWLVKPQDYVLYCVKYQNKYSGWWLTNHSMSTDNIEKAKQVQITTRSLTQSVYTVTASDNSSVDLLLTFDSNENCTITSLTNGVTATGTGSWGDDTEKKAWGDKDRDGMELNYTITLADGTKNSVSEKLVWLRSGVKQEFFEPTYNK